MNKEQRKKLKKLLEEKEYWTTMEINALIKDEFDARGEVDTRPYRDWLYKVEKW